jgi:hypothetical protein
VERELAVRNPWVGLRPFETGESDLFFGRDREVRILGNLIATLPAVVVFAPSGTGKSSLLNAGVIPEFNDDDHHVVIPIRDPHDDVMERTRATLLATGWTPKPAKAEGRPENLPALLQEHWNDTDMRAVIVVDQFEERANSSVPTQDVFDTVARLTHTGTDAACVVISIREDYLGSLEPVMRRVPGLLNGSYRVPALSRDDLVAAIRGPLRRLSGDISLEDELIEKSLDDLDEQSSRRQEPGEQRFEPGYFQIVWSTLWDELPGSGGGALTLDHYSALGGADRILKDFTASTLDTLEPASAEMFWAMTRYLVLPTGAKAALTIDDLATLIQDTDFLTPNRPSAWLAATKREMRALLIRRVFQALTASGAPLFQRVIRSDREEFELLHDVLGTILLDWRKDYESAWQARTERVLSQAEWEGTRWLEGWSRRRRSGFAIEDWGAAVTDATLELRSYIANVADGTPDPVHVKRVMAEKAAIAGYGYYSARRISVKEEAMRDIADDLAAWTDAWATVTQEGLTSESETVRRGLQELLPVWSLPTEIELMPRGVQSQVIVATAAVLGVGATIVAYLFTELISGGLDIHYAALTMAHLGVACVFVYAVVFDETAGRWPMRTAECIAPILGDPGTSAPGRPRWTARFQRLVRLAATWPLPAIWPAAVGVAMAAGFDALGWAATAGFNEGVLLGGLLTLVVGAFGLDY